MKFFDKYFELYNVKFTPVRIIILSIEILSL